MSFDASPPSLSGVAELREDTVHGQGVDERLILRYI